MAPIPDRWLNYKPIGEVLPGTRIIAFKVPLSLNITSKLDKEISLDIDKLLAEVPNLGLVIDLTNTNRYYDPETFLSRGVQYEKIMVPGRQIPNQFLKKRFISIVNNFLAANRNNNKLIGVHCTHGVNRTGFMICNYMVKMLHFSANVAINCFEKARGHKIERNNYCQAIRDDVKAFVRGPYRPSRRQN